MRTLTLTIALGLAIACSDGEAKPEEGLGFDDGASHGVATSALVSATSSAQLELSTGAIMKIPAGAVSVDVEVGMRRPSDDEARKLLASLPANQPFVSAPYIVTPHGFSFSKGVQVSLPVRPGVEVEQMAVAWLEDEADTSWELLGYPVRDGRLATIELSHFSVLVLVDWSESGIDGGISSQGPGLDGGGHLDRDVVDSDGGAAADGAGRDAANAPVRGDAGAEPTEQDAGTAHDAGTQGAGAPDASSRLDAAAPADGSSLVDAGWDGGSQPSDAGGEAICGDGVVTEPEECDTGIPAGQPGACPDAGQCAAMSEGCYEVWLVDQGPCYRYCVADDVCEPDASAPAQ